MISEEKNVGILIAEEKEHSAKPHLGWGLPMLLCIGFFAIVSVWRLAPPNVVPASAPPTEFSSERAMSHVRVIAKEAHAVGTTGHKTVRDYIVNELTAHGLSPEVQENTAFVNNYGTLISATVYNIIARLKGVDNSKGVLLVAHYDSMQFSPGASDNAVGVATLLETLRALKSGPPLKNDVILLFTDAEEIGQLGARAFVKSYPQAKDVGVVLNFDARGTNGPVFMFQSTPNNGWMIKKLAKAVQYPSATSYMHEVYKTMPNSTDLGVFKEAGFPGLNFAYINGVGHFHTPHDNVQNLDERSLQHSGLYALGLTRELGGEDLNNIKEKDAVYFDLLGLTLVHYSSRMVIPLWAFITLLFVGVVVIGVRRKQLTFRGAAMGFLLLSLCVICAGLTSWLIWKLIQAVSPPVIAGSHSSNLIFLGLIALTVIIVYGAYSQFARRVSVENLAIGGLFCWLILMGVASFTIPGASYLFAWPLFFSLLPLGLLFASAKARKDSPWFLALLAVCAIPGIILIAPTIYALYMGIGLTLPGALMVLLALLIGLLIPHLSILTMPKWKFFIPIVGLPAIAFLVAGALTSGYSLDHPKPTSFLYAQNADKGTAIWASGDQKTDHWTSQFIPASARRSEMLEFFPLRQEFISAAAPVIPLQPPSITRISESNADGARTLQLRLASPREAHMIEVVTEKDVEVTAAWINGQEVNPVPKKRLMLRYFGAARQGVDLTLVTNSTRPLNIQVVDYLAGLSKVAGLPAKERPADLMPTPRLGWMQDSVAVSKSYTF